MSWSKKLEGWLEPEYDEPWKVGLDNWDIWYYWIIEADEEKKVCMQPTEYHPWPEGASIYPSKVEGVRVAERIAAAVNACRGINQEALKSDIVAEIIEFLKWLADGDGSPIANKFSSDPQEAARLILTRLSGWED